MSRNNVLSDQDTGQHEHPRVLVFGDKDVAAALTEDGYRVTRATFGAPRPVEVSTSYEPLPAPRTLPDIIEQEIVIADLQRPEPFRGDPVRPAPGEQWIWQKASRGQINGAPWSMISVRGDFDHLWKQGGVFIYFLAPKIEYEYLFAPEHRGRAGEGAVDRISSWASLTALDRIGSLSEEGEKICHTTSTANIPGLVRELDQARFSCSLQVPDLDGHEHWFDLGKNTRGHSVAGALIRIEEGRRSLMLVLPRIEDKAAFLRRLFREYLPEITPHLFPHVQNKGWIEQAPYELPVISEKEAEIAIVRQVATERVNALGAEIEEARSENKFLFDLLTEEGDDLVVAVERTLGLLGFEQVKNVDQEADAGVDLREDLQILDRSPTLLIEVKGIRGRIPKEDDVLAINRYIVPRTRAWNRQDVRGLTILNQERNVPPLEREHDNLFQKDAISNAEHLEIGLMTTWTLFRLARAYQRHDWKPEYVADLFYRSGVIAPVPVHYERVGTVSDAYPKAGALAIELTDDVSVGDLLAYDAKVEYEQDQITSMQLDDADVVNAEAGSKIGIGTTLGDPRRLIGAAVYRVRDLDADAG